MIGEDPGSVFVHRNIANLVANNDFNCMSVIQYAVDVLKVKHIIVCGHYDCGGVRASLDQLDHKSPLENWLRNIRDIHRLHRAELSRIKEPIARQRRLVELNVIEQCLNIFKTAVVQKRRVEVRVKVAFKSKRMSILPLCTSSHRLINNEWKERKRSHLQSLVFMVLCMNLQLAKQND